MQVGTFQLPTPESASLRMPDFVTFTLTLPTQTARKKRLTTLTPGTYIEEVCMANSRLWQIKRHASEPPRKVENYN